MCENPHTSKRPPIGKLFHLKNCVKKNVYVPFFARNACLPYRKNGFKAHFFRFAHFFRYGFFYLKLVALPRALQSKRLGTTHIFCGGALVCLLDWITLVHKSVIPLSIIVVIWFHYIPTELDQHLCLFLLPIDHCFSFAGHDLVRITSISYFSQC